MTFPGSVDNITFGLSFDQRLDDVTLPSATCRVLFSVFDTSVIRDLAYHIVVAFEYFDEVDVYVLCWNGWGVQCRTFVIRCSLFARLCLLHDSQLLQSTLLERDIAEACRASRLEDSMEVLTMRHCWGLQSTTCLVRDCFNQASRTWRGRGLHNITSSKFNQSLKFWIGVSVSFHIVCEALLNPCLLH